MSRAGSRTTYADTYNRECFPFRNQIDCLFLLPGERAPAANRGLCRRDVRCESVSRPICNQPRGRRRRRKKGVRFRSAARINLRPIVIPLSGGRRRTYGSLQRHVPAEDVLRLVFAGKPPQLRPGGGGKRPLSFRFVISVLTRAFVCRAVIILSFLFSACPAIISNHAESFVIIYYEVQHGVHGGFSLVETRTNVCLHEVIFFFFGCFGKYEIWEQSRNDFRGRRRRRRHQPINKRTSARRNIL